MAGSAEQTTKWVAEKISEMPNVLEAIVIGPNTLQTVRDVYEPFVAGVISVSEVTDEIVRSLLNADSTIKIVVNVPRLSRWTGTAIAAVAAQGIAFGGIGDLMSAISDEDVGAYVRSEYKFIERGLNQHNRISRWEREFDRVYRVHRYGLSSLRFIILNEYELTGDDVRTARCRYGAFDAIVINNPNGKATTSAGEVAASIEVSIFKWGQFLARLNSD